MESIVYSVILLVSLLYLARKMDDIESYFPLKIIGYFVLGSFAFNFNQISLPLGFLAYLMFFRPKLNVYVKRLAAVFGVLAFILIQWFLPYAIHEWESRPRFIKHEVGSAYAINFEDEYKLIRQKLNLKNDSLRLEDFEVDYVADGKMRELRWQLVGQNGNSYNLYQIRYDISKSRYRLTYSRIDTWPQYNRLIDADRFFEILNVLNIKDITHTKGEFSYYVIQSSGERVNYTEENQTHLIISNGQIQSLDDEQLPVDAYYISTIAMKKTDEERDEQGNLTQESFEGTESSEFLFDVKFSEK